jgi:DNA repair exonuclease SbcCD nuclease subunit
MSEIRFVTSSDEHLCEIAPGFRKDNYKNSILQKMIWQGELAKRVSADALFRIGDLFHVKASNKTTMGTVAEVARIHRAYSCPTHAVSGNHDMSYNDPGSIPRQPIGVLYRSNVFQHIQDQTFTSGSMNVRVVGVDFTVDLDDEGLRDKVRKRDGDTYTIALVHALAAHSPSEKFSSFFSEKIFDYRDLVYEGCPDVYVFGHYHKDQGVQTHLGVQFVNVGAVSRGALTFENLDRIPKVTHITCNSQGISIDVHKIPCDDAKQIFDLELKKTLDTNRRDLEDFIHILRTQSQTPQDGGVQNFLAQLERTDYPTDLKQVILDTAEAAEAGLVDE